MAAERQLWEIVEGPIPCVPLHNPEDSASWAFRLRHLEQSREWLLFVRATWRGFDAVDEIPAELTKRAYASHGRLGADWALTQENPPDEVIFHSQSRRSHHIAIRGPDNRPRLVRLDEPPAG